MATKSYGRAAAWTAAVILGVVAGFQFYWGLGGTWGLHEVSGGTAPPVSASTEIDVVIIGLVDLASAGVLLARVGYWRERVPFAIARIGAWAIAIASLGGALGELGAHTDFERFANGSVLLIIALLAFVVARSELPTSPGSGAAPTPSRKPGPPTPAH
ncbi:MAG: DUF3995 domain-containing protein [Solirubrobacteraceae bacterium]